jgi:hypothetical protein
MMLMMERYRIQNVLLSLENFLETFKTFLDIWQDLLNGAGGSRR